MNGACWWRLDSAGVAEGFFDEGCQVERAVADGVHDRVVLGLEIVLADAGEDFFDLGFGLAEAAEVIGELVEFAAIGHVGVSPSRRGFSWDGERHVYRFVKLVFSDCVLRKV